MLSVAGMYDLVGLIPFSWLLLTPLAWLHFWMWFTIRGVPIGFTKPKKLATMGLGSLVEAVPALGEASPTWILAIGIQLLMIRLEDKTGLSVTSVTDIAKGDTHKLSRRAKEGPQQKQSLGERYKRTQRQREAISRVQNVQGIRQKRKEAGGNIENQQ